MKIEISELERQAKAETIEHQKAIYRGRFRAQRYKVVKHVAQLHQDFLGYKGFRPHEEHFIGGYIWKLLGTETMRKIKEKFGEIQSLVAQTQLHFEDDTDDASQAASLKILPHKVNVRQKETK